MRAGYPLVFLKETLLTGDGWHIKPRKITPVWIRRYNCVYISFPEFLVSLIHFSMLSLCYIHHIFIITFVGICVLFTVLEHVWIAVQGRLWVTGNLRSQFRLNYDSATILTIFPRCEIVLLSKPWKIGEHLSIAKHNITHILWYIFWFTNNLFGIYHISLFSRKDLFFCAIGKLYQIGSLTTFLDIASTGNKHLNQEKQYQYHQQHY